MKRIMSIILVLVILCGNISVFSAEVTEVSPETKSALEFLSALGIYVVDEEKIDGFVTRQEFAAIAYKIMTGSEFPLVNSDVSLFDDVTGPEYISYVNAVVNHRLMSGYADGSFRPMQEITVIEAATVFVRILGYDLIAESNGGYPSGYYFTASNIGFFKNVSFSANDELTYGELAVLIRNVITAEVKSRKSFSEDGKVEFSDEKSSILESIFKIGMVNDIVTGIDITSLSGESDVPPWKIRVGNLLLYVGTLTPNDLLGYKVKAYYYKDNEKLLYIEADDKNNVTEIDVENIIDIVKNEIITEENGKKKSYTYSLLADFIYNNGATESLPELELFNGKTGKITLIDNNGDKKTDVIKADVYYDIVIDRIDTINKTATDLYTGKTLNLDMELSNPYVVMTDAEGNLKDISSLNRYNVLSVYETLPDSSQQYIKVIMSNSRINGTVKGIGYDDNGNTLVAVGNTEYQVASDKSDAVLSNINVGEIASLMVNFEYKVVGVVGYVSAAMKYAMLMHCASFTKDMEDNFIARVYTQDAESSDLNFSKNVKIDGSEYKGNDISIFSHLKASSDVAVGNDCVAEFYQLIKYTLDSEGNINCIDTVLKSYNKNTGEAIAGTIFDEPDSFNALYVGPSSPYTAVSFYWNLKCYNKNTMISENTKVFDVPSLTVRDQSRFLDSRNYKTYASSSISGYDRKYTSYYDNPNDYTAAVITHYNDTASDSGYTGYFYIFDKLSEVITQDGRSCYKIYCWKDGKYTSIYADPSVTWTDSLGKLGKSGAKISLKDLKEGDAIRVSFDDTSVVDGFLLYMRADGNIKTGVDVNVSSMTNASRIVSAYLYKYYDNGVSFVITDDTASLVGTDKFEYLRSNVPVVFYDSKAPEGHRVTIDKFRSADYYVTDGDACSRIYINMSKGLGTMAYIIK